MGEITETLDTAADVAVASSKGLFRAVAIGAVPLIEFGAIIAITLLVVRLPLMLFDREA
jgi:hypothetical protein